LVLYRNAKTLDSGLRRNDEQETRLAPRPKHRSRAKDKRAQTDL
jgi:hypothetical protein